MHGVRIGKMETGASGVLRQGFINTPIKFYNLVAIKHSNIYYYCIDFKQVTEISFILQPISAYISE